MPLVELPASPHAPGNRPVKIHYRDVGSGRTIIFLHGGWGYRVYPINRQTKKFENQIRFIIPDRSGYGRSTQLSGEMPTDFHQRAAEETLLVLDQLGIERATFWGHSDGAVIAAMIGLSAPQRCERLILEAFHFRGSKPGSRGFFEKFAMHPEELNEDVQELLIADHGEDQWSKVVQRNCRAWLKLAAESRRSTNDSAYDLATGDLYHGRLNQLTVPVTFIHGRGDPRTEPGEIERACAAVKGAELRFIEEGRHSPHSEKESWREFNQILDELLAE